jgi:hypothetical protein
MRFFFLCFLASNWFSELLSLQSEDRVLCLKSWLSKLSSRLTLISAVFLQSPSDCEVSSGIELKRLGFGRDFCRFSFGVSQRLMGSFQVDELLRIVFFDFKVRMCLRVFKAFLL